MSTKVSERSSGCSRANVYRLATLAWQEISGGNGNTPTVFVAGEEQLIPPVLQHFQGKRYFLCELQNLDERPLATTSSVLESVMGDSLAEVKSTDYVLQPSTTTITQALMTRTISMPLDTDDVVCTNERKRTPAEVFRAIAVEARLSLKAVGIMLSHLREVFPQLPLSARTLLGTPRECVCTFVLGEEYVHFGLAECISNAVRGRWTEDVNILRLQLHIDGLTLFNSSRLQLWPILGRLISPSTPVFVVGLFCGLSKPVNVAEYLNSVIEDLSTLLKDGLLLSTYNRHVQIVLDCVVGDAPARAFFRQVKNHTGYHCCEKCTAPGVYVNRKMVFPPSNYRSRTNNDFRTRRQEEHHVGQSPFERLNVDMITCFPLDYMHMVCLGMMKRLMNLWRAGPTERKIRLGSSQITQINSRLMRLRGAQTCEFPRKCRSTVDCDRWKATEFRQFLLYIGPVVLKGVVDDRIYENFLNFSVSIYILCCPKWCMHYVDFVESLLRKTLVQFAAIYGESELVFNFHCVSHLCADVRLHGPLDSYSAFPFESYMRTLRGFVRSPNMPTSQIFRRITERMNVQLQDDSAIVDDAKATLIPIAAKKQGRFIHEDDLQLAYKYQGILEQLSDIPSSDATDVMDRGGKRKRYSDFALRHICRQPIVRSDFTYEVEEKRKPPVYSVDIDYSPPPPQLENMSHASQSQPRWTLGSLENLPSFSSPIASSSTIISPPATHSEAVRNNDTAKEVRELKGVIENLVLQNIRVREELHALRLEVNALRFQHAAPVHRGHAAAEYEAGRSKIYTQLARLTFPIHSQQVTFLSSVGGTTMGECTRNIMRTLLTDEMAKTINWRGVNNRVSIASSQLAAAIVESIMKKAYPGVSHADVEGTIQRWIQKARLRASKEAHDLVTDTFAL
ncbi:uncharacterized protein DEA37_0004185 [Paragonimus westermani]|uniref:DUF4806 domain-containing protein n=1 Tax=Paragonimus westermani TaxID=34504 RepID=A0A5J4N785_9TREM|nr:uncharacterized protein DEA37_0004185 [Paragonimus westermani]